MAKPTISVSDREIILLNGYSREPVVQNVGSKPFATSTLVIHEEAELRRLIRNNNDTTAVGYIAGRWVTAA